MPPLLQAAIGSILRALLLGGAGYFVRKGYWTAEDAATYVSAFVVFVLTLAWSLWQKYRQQLTIVAALETPVGTSLEKFTRQQAHS